MDGEVGMIDREKVIEGLKRCLLESNYLYSNPCNGCPYKGQELTINECVDQLKADALSLLKEQEPREITKDEWELWKRDKHRDPLCMYWRGDVTPFWILKPEEAHEPAYLIGDIKIFKGKPDKEKMHKMWLKQEDKE